MVISALFIIGGLLVVILGLSGDFMNPTMGILAGTLLFVFGLIILRRQKRQIRITESRIPPFEEGSSIPEPSETAPSNGLEISQTNSEETTESDQNLIGEPVFDQDDKPEPGEIVNEEAESDAIEEDTLKDESDVNDEDASSIDAEAASPIPTLPPMPPSPPLPPIAAVPPVDPVEREFVKVASMDEVKMNACHSVDVNGVQIVLVNLDGEFFAMRDNCSHARARLSAGDIEGNEIVCPLHGATFNIKTGEATGPPAYNGVKTYQVRVTGSDLELEV